ncbi:HNH endonuclease signature motif containing protein [Stutzerimonas nitrititolerans]|uniref:HNH endonuclease signature motif containing protein n=1 Tax=Stutzerimonas nitrititolerans TaxID=2482751 RepID=UPI0028B1EC95|nr:HNH endonuclease signature motif containing protein [Stutzerimonas nitrititolerans]
MDPESGRRKTGWKAWSAAEDELLSEYWKTLPLGEVAQRMARSTSSVYNRVQKLKLKRTDEYKAITGCGRIKKGDRPWNAGLKGWQAGGRAKATQFKPGHKPSNTWRPIGAERTSKDGILFRKVADTGVKKADWKAVHQLTWEEHNGPLPEGHIVVFVDRNRENMDPGNLIAVTRAENMRRNSIDRYPPEYRSTALTLGWFRRKLNKLETEHEQSI